MAVIKIVPMPGAVGDKGDEGAVGPQGQQGPAGQNGLPGTPALWSYQGAWNSSAAYAVGDVVVYQGQLYYTKSVTTAGTLPTVTAKFDLIASKGADGTNGINGTNGTNGTNGADGAPGAAGADFGIYYLGNYNPTSGYLPNIAVVRGSDGQLYLAKASGALGDPVGNTAQWEVWIPKGADGTNGTNGTNGADALWNYTGEYSGGAAYAVGDLATYDGQLWYRYNSNGGNVGDTPSPGLWNLLAAKGADGSQLNYWDGIEQPNPHQPAEPGFLVVDGITRNSSQPLYIGAADKIYLTANNGEFIGDPNIASNQIATIGDIPNTNGSWTVTTGTNTYNFTLPSSGTYVMWVEGNIPNGIIVWNATVTVTNANVPAIGSQYAWNYTSGGSPLLITAIPNQIIGTAGTISTDTTYLGNTSNRFDFTIANTSGSSITVYYGYTKI